MRKHFFDFSKFFIQALYYIAVAVAVGLLFIGWATVTNDVKLFAVEKASVLGVMVYAFLIGTVSVSIYQAKKKSDADKKYKAGLPANTQYVRRPVNDADIEAYLNTPAGVDAVYRVIRNKNQKRKVGQNNTTAALATKVSENSEQSKNKSLIVTNADIDNLRLLRTKPGSFD